MKTIFRALFVVAVALPPVGGAQTVFPVRAEAPVERAALDMRELSSSSASEMFAGAAQSTLTIGPAPVVNKPHTGSRLPFSGIGIGVKAGLGGVGFDVATPLIPGWLNLRGGASFFRYNDIEFTASHIDIVGALKFQNAAVVVDVFPFHGGFRLSGGMTVFNDSELSANLSVPPGKSFTLGSDTYYSSASDPIHGTGSMTFGGRTAGRASLGWGNMVPRKGHFVFESEFGVQFFTPPTVLYNISGSGCQSANDPLTCGPVEQKDVLAEQNKLQNDLTNLQYYPIVSFGVSYKIH